MSKLSFQNDNDISKNFDGLEISFFKTGTQTGTQNKKQKVEKKDNYYATLEDDNIPNIQKYLKMSDLENLYEADSKNKILHEDDLSKRIDDNVEKFKELAVKNFKELQKKINEFKTNDEFEAFVNERKDGFYRDDDENDFFKMRNQNITQIPDSLFLKIKNLKKFMISNTPITSLPSSIRKLDKLEKLDILACNSLTSLPQEIGDLHNLKTLTIINCNSLTSLPKEIGKLDKLEELYIVSSSVESLPKQIGDLHNLTKLYIYECNALTSIPEEIKDLKKYDVDIRTTPMTLLDN